MLNPAAVPAVTTLNTGLVEENVAAAAKIVAFAPAPSIENPPGLIVSVKGDVILYVPAGINPLPPYVNELKKA